MKLTREKEERKKRERGEGKRERVREREREGGERKDSIFGFKIKFIQI